MYSATAVNNIGVLIKLPDILENETNPLSIAIPTFILRKDTTILKSVSFDAGERVCSEFESFGQAYFFWDDLYGTTTRLDEGDYSIEILVEFYDFSIVYEVLSFTIGELTPEVIQFAPHFAIKTSSDRESLIIYDAENNWPGDINLSFNITVVSSYENELGVSIEKTLSNTDLDIPSTTLKEGFEISVPASLIETDMQIIPDSIYTVTLDVVQDNTIVASRELESVICQGVKDYIYNEVLNLNPCFLKWNDSRDIVIHKAQLDVIDIAMGDDNQSTVISVLKYFKNIV